MGWGRACLGGEHDASNALSGSDNDEGQGNELEETQNSEHDATMMKAGGNDSEGIGQRAWDALSGGDDDEWEGNVLEEAKNSEHDGGSGDDKDSEGRGQGAWEHSEQDGRNTNWTAVAELLISRTGRAAPTTQSLP